MFVQGPAFLLLLSFTAYCNQAESIGCNRYKTEGIFRCRNENPQIVTIYDQDHKCASGYMCNYNYVSVLTKCSPCIKISKVCGDTFDCLSDTRFKMASSEFDCPQYTKCNKHKQTSCEPCLEEKCSTDAWECHTEDPHKVTIGSLKITCPGEQICNKDYTQPCEPCIDGPSLFRI